jgi:hypothetical protein
VPAGFRKRRIFSAMLFPRDATILATIRKKYRDLVELTRQVKQELDAMIPPVNQVLRQTTAQVFRGVTNTPRKIVSVIQSQAEVIRKGKVNKPTEFGQLVKIQEAKS